MFYVLFSVVQDDKKQPEEDEEGMGTADIKYGDSTVVVQHAATGYWLSYQTYETKKRGNHSNDVTITTR